MLLLLNATLLKTLIVSLTAIDHFGSISYNMTPKQNARQT